MTIALRVGVKLLPTGRRTIHSSASARPALQAMGEQDATAAHGNLRSLLRPLRQFSALPRSTLENGAKLVSLAPGPRGGGAEFAAAIEKPRRSGVCIALADHSAI
jgi:hypothetical protein